MSFFLPDRNKPLCQLMVESMTEHVSRLLSAFMSGVYLQLPAPSRLHARIPASLLTQNLKTVC